MKVFMAMPYSQLCDDNYILKPIYKEFCVKLIERMEQYGWEYFLAHKRENWGKQYSSDKESTLIDFNTIKDSDIICVIPGIPSSGGVHVEIGWASSNNKKINIFLNREHFYSPMVTGLDSIADVKYYYYSSEYSDELINLIIKSITERKMNK